jgi:hypothetical protein
LAVNDFTNTLHTEINAPLAAWLAAENRQEGDIDFIANTTTTVADDGTETTVINGYYVAYFKSKTDNQNPLSNVRHLLVKFEGGTENEETGEIEYSEEEKSAAKAEADEYLKTWNEGAKTEDSFIELVKAHSDDTSAEEGGLFEDIHPNSSYVENFLNWAIDDARYVGETGIVETEYGYHIMFYVGESELSYRDTLITEQLRSEAMTEWENGLVEASTLTVKNTGKVKTDLKLNAGK